MKTTINNKNYKLQCIDHCKRNIDDVITELQNITNDNIKKLNEGRTFVSDKYIFIKVDNTIIACYRK